MPIYSLQFELPAEDSDHVAALQDALKEALPEFDLAVEHHTAQEQETRFGGPETLAWIAIVIALPAAAQATIGLADRLKLKPKIDGMIAWASHLRKDKGVRIRWGLPGGVRKPLDQSTTNEIIDALNHLADHGRSE